MRAVLDQIMMQADASIEADLVTGDIRTDIVASPFATAADRNTVWDLEPELRMAARDLFDLLADSLREIHPQVYEARVSLDISVERNTRQATVSPCAIIDGRPWSGALFNLQSLLREAGKLACVTAKGPLRLFVLEEARDTGAPKVNLAESMRYASATSLAHAAVIFDYNFARQYRIREAHPVAMAEIMETRQARELAMVEIYAL